jgi:hypothetical protein
MKSAYDRRNATAMATKKRKAPTPKPDRLIELAGRFREAVDSLRVIRAWEEQLIGELVRVSAQLRNMAARPKR